MFRSRILTVAVLIALLGPEIPLAPRTATAQEAADGLTTDIYAGTCADTGGEQIATLVQPNLTEGDAVGSSDARPVATSFSTVPLSLDALLAEGHVIAVVEEQETAACGAVGGLRTGAGAIVIELSEQSDSGLSGVAYLAPSGAGPGQTDVSLFLAGLDTVQPETRAEPTLDATVETSQQDLGDSTEESIEQTATGTETYVSPNYGFSINYDPAVWTVGYGPTTEGDVDIIGFSVFGTDISFGGFPYAGDARSCAAGLAESVAQQPDVVSSEPLLEGGVPVAGGDASDAFQAIVLTRTDEDSSTYEQAYYARCIELIPGAAKVGIQQWSAAVFYDVAAQQREELVAGLVVP